jgi:DNA-binding transcriptional LysR family regulator
MNIEGISLDQLRAVLAVVDTGSFSGAARSFGRAQSAVSYAVAQTEQQLGVALFDRAGYRPVLTAAGRLLVADIRAIVARADDLRARAQAVAQGVEPEITLVLDALLSPEAAGRLLAEFHAAFPTVPVRVHVETLGMLIERVLAARTALGVIATMIDLPDGLARHTLPSLVMRAVAAPGHPLAGVAAAGAGEAVQAAIQIVLSERGRRTEGRDYAVYSPRTWRVDELAVKRALIGAGVGWGSLPAWMVDDDLAAGRLAAVQVPGLPEIDAVPVQAFHDAGHRPGPAMSWLIGRLAEAGLG